MSKVNKKAKSQSLSNFREQKDWHNNLPAMYLIRTNDLIAMLNVAPNKQTKRIILNELNHRGFVFSNGMLLKNSVGVKRYPPSSTCYSEGYGKAVYKQ